MKARKTLVVFSFVCCCYFSGNSQTYKDFDLSTFITPDIVRNELDFSLNSSGQIADYQASTNDNFSINADFQTTFRRFKNTRPYWGKQEATFGLEGSYLNNKLSDLKDHKFNVDLTYQTENRFYKPGKLFYGISGGLALRHNKSKNHAQEYDQKESGAMMSLNIGIGKGRIEPVTDARQAIYILENLTEKGVLDRKLTDEEIVKLSELIATVKNKRFFDARLRLIDEVSAVDSFFVRNHLLKSSGASYFTTLYDYWMYGDRFERLAGTEFYAGLFGNYQYWDAKFNQASNTSKLFQPLSGAMISVTCEKPVNLYWQRSAYASLSGNYFRSTNSFSDQTSKQDRYQASLYGTYGWGYYPTSRTNINFSVNEILSWNGSKPIGDNTELEGTWSSRTFARFKTYYYFSPQLRLAAEVNGGFQYESRHNPISSTFPDKQVGWTGDFLLTLTYSLF